MAGPYFENVAGLAVSASAASLSPALNSLWATGAGVHLACVVSKNNATHNCATAGWTKLDQVNSGASFTASLWIAPQGSAAPTFTWVGAAACHAQLAYYPDPMAEVINNVAASGATGTGNAATHTSTGFVSSANDVLAVYVDACAINVALAAPAGWTENSDTGSATSVTRQVWGSKAIATAGTPSGNISVAGGAADWVQFQIELRQDDTPGHFASMVTVDAFLEPAPGTDFAKVETLAWLDTNDVRFSKVDTYAWLDFIGSADGSRSMSLM